MNDMLSWRDDFSVFWFVLNFFFFATGKLDADERRTTKDESNSKTKLWKVRRARTSHIHAQNASTLSLSLSHSLSLSLTLFLSLSLTLSLYLSIFLSLLYIPIFLSSFSCMSHYLSLTLSFPFPLWLTPSYSTTISLCLSIETSLYLSTSLIFYSCHINLFLSPSIPLSIYSSLHLFLSPSIPLSIYSSLHLFLSPSIALSLHLFLFLSIYSSLSLSLSHSLSLTLFMYTSLSLSLFYSLHLFLSLPLSEFSPRLCIKLSAARDHFYRPKSWQRRERGGREGDRFVSILFSKYPSLCLYCYSLAPAALKNEREREREREREIGESVVLLSRLSCAAKVKQNVYVFFLSFTLNVVCQSCRRRRRAPLRFISQSLADWWQQCWCQADIIFCFFVIDDEAK